jgi:predicted dehydrogenase
MPRKPRVVFVGTGGRANAYAMYGAKEQLEIAGIADVSPAHRRTFLGLNSLVGLVPEFDDWRAMYDATPEIDGVVITTPNHQHLEPALEAMRRGYALALEKPIAESPASCRQLLATKRATNARVIIGFVLRSAPFYLQAYRWLAAGRIGRLTSIQADEIPHVLTTSVMFRSDWRRYQATSGGAMLEKCCHDLDLFTWFAGGAPVRLASHAGCQTFNPRPEVPARCADCHLTATCRYYLPPVKYEHPDMVKKANDGLLYKFVRDNSACIYNNGHDIYDHQTVQLEYDNGVVATLTLDFAGSGKVCGRTLKLVGTDGAIYGKCEDNAISLLDYATDTVTRVDVRDDGSGHGGANREHADAFIRMMNEPGYAPPANLEAGYLSAMLCFAADQSAAEHRLLDISHTMPEAGLTPGYTVSD